MSAPPPKLHRRSLLAAALAGVAVGCEDARSANRRPTPSAQTATPVSPPQNVTLVQFSDSGARKDTVTVPKIVKSEEQWRSQLTPLAFAVTRHGDTELAFTGKYYKLHDKGIYRCICCNNALFSSETKFESGTGWPSFWASIAEENVVTGEDTSFGMERTEVRCRLCDAHLGHVFPDGPEPTRLRYCMNSVSLRFVKTG